MNVIKVKLALLIAIVLWASAYVGIRVGLETYSPGGLALLRYGIASVCMAFFYFRYSKRAKMHFRDKFALLGVGVIGIGIYNITLNYAELSVSSGLASFIISQSPLLTAFFAIFFLKEKLTWLHFSGLAVSIVGVGLMCLNKNGGFNWSIGLAYILLATIAASLYSILQKPFLKKYHTIQATTYVVWGGTLFLLLYSPVLKHDLLTASWGNTVIVIYLGIFPAAIGYIAWNYALSQISVSHAVSFLYFVPFLATLFEWLYLGEAPTLFSIVGGLLAILGVVLVNYSYNKKRLVV